MRAGMRGGMGRNIESSGRVDTIELLSSGKKGQLMW